MDYENLEAPNGSTTNMGGLTSRFYFAPIGDFLSIKEPIAVPINPEDEVDIVTAHTFKTGKCFLIGYNTQNKGKHDIKSQGEIDGKSFMHEAEFFHPGRKSEVAAFVAKAQYDGFIGILENPDSKSNGYDQVGTEMFPAKCTGEYTSATNSDGLKGWMIKFTCPTDKPYYYKAAVSVTPAP